MKIYLQVSSENGYPKDPAIFVECLVCGSSFSTDPGEYAECVCGNVFIDVGAGRLSCEDPAKLAFFRVSS